MTTVAVSSKHQIVIPRVLRDALGIRPAERLHAIEYRGRIERGPVKPARASRGSLRGIETDVPRDPDRV